MKTPHAAARAFVDDLADMQFDSVFNPYSELCPDHDVVDAPSLRRQNLSAVVEAALMSGVESIWIARDLGYRGGRRTGLALTDEFHLTAHAELLGATALSRSTRGPAVAERTATVIWQTLAAIQKPIFLWNVFPLHPHAPDDAMTNRCHSRSERQACRPLLTWLMEHLQPKSVLAIGRDAQLALADLEIDALQVRHPSYGGQTEFREGVFTHYGVAPTTSAEPARLF